MLKLTAEYADIWNGIGTPKAVVEQNRRVDAACAAAGRNPASLSRAVSPSINLLAAPDAVETGVREYQALGVSNFMLWFLDFPSTRGIELFAKEVLPVARGMA